MLLRAHQLVSIDVVDQAARMDRVARRQDPAPAPEHDDAERAACCQHYLTRPAGCSRSRCRFKQPIRRLVPGRPGISRATCCRSPQTRRSTLPRTARGRHAAIVAAPRAPGRPRRRRSISWFPTGSAAPARSRARARQPDHARHADHADLLQAREQGARHAPAAGLARHARAPGTRSTATRSASSPTGYGYGLARQGLGRAAERRPARRRPGNGSATHRHVDGSRRLDAAPAAAAGVSSATCRSTSTRQATCARPRGAGGRGDQPARRASSTGSYPNVPDRAAGACGSRARSASMTKGALMAFENDHGMTDRRGRRARPCGRR